LAGADEEARPQLAVADSKWVLALHLSASAHEVHDLQPIAFTDRRLRVLCTGHDVLVPFHRDEHTTEAELHEERADGGAGLDDAGLAVHLDAHGARNLARIGHPGTRGRMERRASRVSWGAVSLGRG